MKTKTIKWSLMALLFLSLSACGSSKWNCKKRYVNKTVTVKESTNCYAILDKDTVHHVPNTLKQGAQYQVQILELYNSQGKRIQSELVYVSKVN